jgi:hypothetical protein
VRFASNLAAIVMVSSVVFAGEPRPSSESAIKDGVLRGDVLRAKKSLVPAALQKYALTAKVGDVPCARALVHIEDAKGAGGAVYRLSETFNAAMADENEKSQGNYSGVFLLNADLGVISGELTMKTTVITGAKTIATNSRCTLTIKDDELTWERTDEQAGAATQPPKETNKRPLHGVRPLPRNAILALAAFACSEDGFKPNPKEGVCVPTIDYIWPSNSVVFDPAWMSLDLPAYNHPKGTALQVKVRYLSGDIEKDGFVIDSPSPTEWIAAQVFAVDKSMHPLAHPEPEDFRITVTPADPATMDVKAPFDLEKIATAMKAAEEKAEPKK